MPQKITTFSDPAMDLGKLISDRALTDCLELLEQQGFQGETAIFMLGYFGGAA